MNPSSNWKIVIALCGDASDRMPALDTGQSVALHRLLGQSPESFVPAEALLVIQAQSVAAGQTVRLVAAPGESQAHAVSVTEHVADSPALRDDFAAWAMTNYPTQRTLLLLADCKATDRQQLDALGTAFELVPSPDGPDLRPLTLDTLADLSVTTASRGRLGNWLTSLLLSLAGKADTGDSAELGEPAPETGKEDPIMTTERDWTILVYMAGDNGLGFEKNMGKPLMAPMTDAGFADIQEAEEIGTTDKVAVVVQLDTLGEDVGTYRIVIQKGKTTQENILERADTIKEVNTGDPSALAQFIVWGQNRFPAKHTMLVLWNHGLGWKDDDIYEAMRGVSRSARAGHPARRGNVAAFRSTAEKIMEMAKEEENEGTRAILCDDSSMDFLTNVEMSQALRVAQVADDEAEVAAIFADKARLDGLMADLVTGTRRRLSVIGMDACLMAMIEVNYQIRDYAQVMIGSQAIEPMKGWPYTQIVEKLNANSGMGPAELGALVVDEYAHSYASTSKITQSAIDLTKMEEAAQRISTLANAMRVAYASDPALRFAYNDVAKAARQPWNRFRGDDPEYVDLATVARGMARLYQGDFDQVGASSQALLEWLESDDGPVIKFAATGRYAKAQGISIYLPVRETSPLYATLDFSISSWTDFLRTVEDFVPDF